MNASYRPLTTGLEQEIFLLSNNNPIRPATSEQSQAFFKAVADGIGVVPGYDAQNHALTVCFPERAQAVGGLQTILHYDHHPHLIEVSFQPYANLHDLHDEVVAVYDCLERVAGELDLLLATRPLLNLPAGDERLQSDWQLFRNLRAARRRQMERRGRVPHPDAVSYATAIAATHIHIGGLEWNRYPERVAWLYGKEPGVLRLVARLLWANADKADAPSDVLRQRWQGYRDCYENSPLIGFPDLPEWTPAHWNEALMVMPLLGHEEDAWTGAMAGELERLPFANQKEFLYAVRDLQIVKPRDSGTIEFRADPALPTSQTMLASAALRTGLGESARCCAGATAQVDFQKARKAWWHDVNTLSPKDVQTLDNDMKQVLELAGQGLEQRSKGEEKWLQYFYDASPVNSNQGH